jgi:nucleolar protein 12
LLFDGKKYPPMLPRLLRVTRAKAMQKTAKAQERKRKEPFAKPALKAANPNNVVIYNPKMSSQQSSLAGRAARLLGKAGAATFGKRDAILAKGVKDATEGMKKVEDGAIKGPEAFIFEGYRASAKNGKPKDLKLGGKNVKSKGKPKNHGSKRASEWKKSGGAKKAKS